MYQNLLSVESSYLSAYDVTLLLLLLCNQKGVEYLFQVCYRNPYRQSDWEEGVPNCKEIYACPFFFLFLFLKKEKVKQLILDISMAMNYLVQEKMLQPHHQVALSVVYYKLIQMTNIFFFFFFPYKMQKITSLIPVNCKYEEIHIFSHLLIVFSCQVMIQR